jgi:hypothetical protein
MNPTVYPLAWPVGFPRSDFRQVASFKVSLAGALDDLYNELDRMDASAIVISSNMQTRLDGRPLAKQARIEDPGVALYFQRNGRQVCIPCDKWDTVVGNVRAIGLTVAALRSLERWGAKDLVDAAFVGFEALPAHAGAQHGASDWWQVLGVPRDSSIDEIRRIWKQRLREAHPEDHERINNAWSAAKVDPYVKGATA